ncbi:MAG TPA: dienelactone hydrolase family protein, partial [Alphaproteobacteria bacterium]
MAGRMITVAAPGGGAIESYLAAPAAGRGPGVAVVASIYGIEDCVKEYADKLAADGCVAAIPNMFWRDADSGVLPQGPEAHKRAIARSERLDLDTSMADLAAVI